MNFYSTVGKNLRCIRILKGFTQSQVADKVFISRSAYSDIENGKREITFKTAVSVAKVLSIDLYTICDPKFSENVISANTSYRPYR